MCGGSDAGGEAGREGGRGCCTWSRSWRRASLRKIMVHCGTIADLMATMTVAKRTGDDKGWTVWDTKDAIIKHFLIMTSKCKC